MQKQSYETMSDKVLDIDIFKEHLLDDLEDDDDIRLIGEVERIAPDGFDITENIKKLAALENCFFDCDITLELHIDPMTEEDGFLDLVIRVLTGEVWISAEQLDCKATISAFLNTADVYYIEVTEERQLAFNFGYSRIFKRIYKINEEA